MHDLDREVAANGTRIAPLGGTPLFFCKECDSKGVPASILQECDSKEVLARAVQEYDSAALTFGCRTKDLRGFRKDPHSSKNESKDREVPESRKLDLNTDGPRASDSALRIASMFYFTARVKPVHSRERQRAHSLPFRP
jgi:hypothetical protein